MALKIRSRFPSFSRHNASGAILNPVGANVRYGLRARVQQAILAAVDIGMILVARDKQDGARIAVGKHAGGDDFQISHCSVLPEESM